MGTWSTTSGWLTSFDLASLIMAVAVFLLIRSYKAPRRPPGPPALPLVGHLHLLGELPHRSLSNLSERYGPLMWLRFGSRNVIVASCPHIAKQILSTHDLVFANRPTPAAAVRMFANCSDMGFSQYGSPVFKFVRHLFAKELFSPKRLAELKHIRTEEIRSLLPVLLRNGDSGSRPVTVRPSFTTASHNITCRMVMGCTLSELSGDDDNAVVDAVDEVTQLVGVFNIGDFIPWLDWLDLQGYLRRMDRVAEKAHAVLQKAIDNRKAVRATSPPPANPDLLDKMLQATVSNAFDFTFTDSHIIANLMDLFVGGSDTTPVTIEWILGELVNHPMVLQKAQEEIDVAVGQNRLVDESDIPNLPYLCAIVKETMRLHPAAPLLVPHVSSNEVKIEGFVIPPNTIAYVNAWALGRDPKTWEKPLDFSPERFLGSDIDTFGQHFELLPFGTGRRGCPGRALGMLNVHLMLATLLQAFNWSIPTKSNSIDLLEEFGITIHMKKPLNVFAIPRLSKDLYNHGLLNK